MNKKKWYLLKSAPKKFIEQFPEYSKITLQLLYNRGFRTKEKIEKFLNPEYERDLHNPFLMKDMKRVVERIKKAINKKEKILIYGDYDVDGVTAVAVLYKTLKILKAVNLDYYIPDRNIEGYGLNKEAINELIKEKIKLIITVDCGISNYEEVKLARQSGIDVIITDHHLVLSDLPPAYAVLNPYRKNDHYPFIDLAGVGVAFKLTQALLEENKQKYEPFLKWMMDLVALGTIADSVPLINENRIFAKYGLIVLKKTKNLGLRALMAKSKVNPANLDIEAVNFQLVPRLNAASRMDHAYTSLKLLITGSYREVEKIAENLDALNNQRQRLIERILKEIKEDINERKIKDKILVLSGKDWPSSILGLVAGKLSEELYKPVILINQEDYESKGGARSIEGFNITETLEKCSDLLIKFGGHEQAAGFSLKTKKIDIFNKKIIRIANNEIKKEDLVPKISIDAEIDLSDISWSLYKELEKFKPFGEKNLKPIFLLKNVEIVEIYGVGSGEKHLKLHFKNEEKIIKAIGFNLGNLLGEIRNRKKVDLICSLETNYWNGNCDLELQIYDLN